MRYLIICLLLAGCGGTLDCWSTGQSGSGGTCAIKYKCTDGTSGEVRMTQWGSIVCIDNATDRQVSEEYYSPPWPSICQSGNKVIINLHVRLACVDHRL